jgi:hypothetical protein
MTYFIKKEYFRKLTQIGYYYNKQLHAFVLDVDDKRYMVNDLTREFKAYVEVAKETTIKFMGENKILKACHLELVDVKPYNIPVNWYEEVN